MTIKISGEELRSVMVSLPRPEVLGGLDLANETIQNTLSCAQTLHGIKKGMEDGTHLVNAINRQYCRIKSQL